MMQLSEHGVRLTLMRRPHDGASTAASYDPHVAEQIDRDRRYAVMRAGRAEYAYSDYDAFVRALGQVWSAGLVPEPIRSTRGAELPAVAPNLQGVDLDLADLRVAEVRSLSGRFDRRSRRRP